MDNKTSRFLTSINLDPNEFDLSFEVVKRDEDDNSKWIFKLIKNKFWDFDLLDKFLSAIKSIEYKYEISFKYNEEITDNKIESLFLNWYKYTNRNDFKGSVIVALNKIEIIYDDESDYIKNEFNIKDFDYILNFISIGYTSKSSYNKKIVDEYSEIKEEDKIKEEKVIIENDNDEDISSFTENYLKQYTEKLQDIRRKENFKLYRYSKNNKYFLCENISNLKDQDIVEIIGDIYDGNLYSSKNGKKTFIGGIGNYTGGIRFKARDSKDVKIEDVEKVVESLTSKAGKTIVRASLKGIVLKDEKTFELMLNVHYLTLLPPKELRKDLSEEKRVELHLHSNMSQLDGIGKPEDYVKLAINMGHKAIAITDHGVVQAHPYMMNAISKCPDKIKILYGAELYIVDRKQNYIFNPSNVRLDNATYVCLDLETTGLSARYDKIIEFGAVKYKNDILLDSTDILINPGIGLEKGTTMLTHITDSMLVGKEDFINAWPKIKEFIGDSIIVTHNTAFDISMLNGELERAGLDVIRNPVIDTLSLSRYLFSDSKFHNLGTLSKRLGLDVYEDESAHRADFDAKVLGEVWCAIKSKLLANNTHMLHEDLGKLDISDSIYKHIRPFHVTVYAKNQDGLKDLYKLISLSHLNYFYDVPRVPRDELEKVRKNLIIGSGCFSGEIFEAAHTKTKKVLSKMMKFYDFIEVQPLTCYSPLIHKTRSMKVRYDDAGNKIHEAIPMPELKNNEEVIRTIKDIIDVAGENNILVCATGDVHYVNPEDKILREIYIAADGLNHRAHPFCTNPRGDITNHVYYECGDQHFRSTDEMLKDFSYLGEEKAKEIVITNTNKIADMFEVVKPVKDRLFTPTIPNADENLRKMAYDKAKELYGDPIPELIVKRLEREFSRIIGDKESYAVNYLLAKQLVEKSNQDGYFVGSRGSVGSSFVATLLGITEVNPLPAHYYCPKCKKLEFVDDVNYLSGADLPEKNCEICGEKLIRDGQNIPFETFLGFDEKSTKVPDIDLNFANEYQAKAHQYLRDLFGKDHVFRAGTVSAYQDKQTFGCVRDYFTRSLHKNFDTEVPKPFAAFLASKASGVKKTTGQHPGGIILIPKEYNVHEFTPIQHPADDDDSGWETTHFEFSMIHETVLKLDLLGHKDPLALKKLAELTKFDFAKIPLGEKKVLSLFTSPKALELKENFLNLETGTMGLPEFGTPFVQGVLKGANAKKFNDLLIVSGITHGTDVWLNNAEDLLKSGIAKSLSDIIGCRDDIMTFFMSKGVPNDISFKIMEDVRKGKKIKGEYLPILKEHNIPEYYIESCNKIKYLFPRAHACAYVTQAVRVGYYKVYYPLEFYAVFFSTRCDDYDIESMVKGEDATKLKYATLKEKSKTDKLSPKEENIISTLEMCIEMFERGFKFSNIDINKSLAKDFIVDKENKALIPPFIVLDGLGEAAANGIVEARNKKQFLSINDFASRCPVSKRHLQSFRQLGVFEGIQEDDQFTLFDFSF